MKSIFTLIFTVTLSIFTFSQTINLTSFATGLSSIVEITHAGDNRLFIVEQAGIIKILNPNGAINATPFLDISSLVEFGGERGLLGLAFAPDYATSGRFYINYTDNSSVTEPNTVIARYTVSSNPNIANSSGTILLTYKQPFPNHNAGKLAFGKDNFLYIGSGDGGSAGDPGDRAQDVTSHFGKLLRIDVSGASYTIPTTNPYANSANGASDPRPEIFAIGLRNPWKFSFDKDNGDLWIADVGQKGYEEINKVTNSGTPGDNYGWRCYEGINHPFDITGNCPSGGFNNTVSPVAEYAHTGVGCTGSITGGYLYRGTLYPDFSGKYFFADYCKRTIGILTNTGTSWSLASQTPNITNNWTTFGEDVNGELYIASNSTIYKISDANLSTNGFSKFDFKLYYTSFKGIITLDLNARFNKVKSLSIQNILGQTIITKNTINKQVVEISTENYNSGLYFVEIQLKDNSRAVKKFIIN